VAGSEGSEGSVGSEGSEGSVGSEVGLSASSAAREYERRTLRFNDTRQTVWIAFTKDDYAVAKSSLVGRVSADERESEHGAGEDPLGYVPYDQRLYDTLMQLFSAERAPESGIRRSARPHVVVHAPLELLLGCSAAGVAEIQGVGPVSAEVARRLACDARVVLSVETSDGSILDQGRARREPTVPQRIEIARRDKGCRFPGCTFTEFTDVHHVQHWVKGGATDLDNLVTLCGRHHRAVHELGWTMVGNANAVMSFTSPHGRVMRSVPSPTWRRTSPVRAARDGPLRR